MTMTVRRTVTVLQDDIDNGVPQKGDRCAIARAARRDLADLLPDGGWAGVDALRLALYSDALPRLAGFIPAEASRFVERFDAGRPVEPFKFEVELVRIVPLGFPLPGEAA